MLRMTFDSQSIHVHLYFWIVQHHNLCVASSLEEYLQKEKIPSRASCLPDTFHYILYLLRHHHLMLLNIWYVDLLVA